MSPDLILAPSRSDSVILDAIQIDLILNVVGSLELRPTGEFTVKNALKRILAIQIPGLDDVKAYMETLFSLSTNETTICCMGSLVEYSTRSNLQIQGIRYFSLNDYMYVSSETFRQLSIFEDECHPNRQCTASKEGLSLFGILNRTRSPMGKLLLKQWFLRPCLNASEIYSRQQCVSILMDPKYLSEILEIKKCLSKTQNIVSTINKIRTFNSISIWQSIHKVSGLT